MGEIQRSDQIAGLVKIVRPGMREMVASTPRGVVVIRLHVGPGCRDIALVEITTASAMGVVPHRQRHGWLVRKPERFDNKR